MAAESQRDSGFTLIEIVVALMILGIVMAALAPAFYGSLRASSTTNDRSVANGLAVTASEQLRSVPYTEVGYQTSADEPGSCTTRPYPVVLGTGVTTPIAATTTQTISLISYTLVRCLYWVNSSMGPDTQAYKQSVVTVSWTAGGGAYHLSQTSALYPGGEGPWSGPQNDFLPGGSTTTIASAPPSTPTNVAAVDDPTNYTSQIDVSWTISSPFPASYYIVQYSSSPYSGSGPLLAPFTSSPPVYGTSWNATVASGATYYFQVVAVAGAGVTTSPPSSPVASAATLSGTTTTTAAPTTTTTTTTLPGSTTIPGSTTTTTTVPPTTTTTTIATCTLSNLVVTPTTAVVNQKNKLKGSSSFQLSVNASAACSNVTVGYTTTGSTIVFAAMTGTVPGTITGTAGNCSTQMLWDTGNHKFTVYLNGVQYAPLTQKLISISAQNGTSAC